MKQLGWNHPFSIVYLIGGLKPSIFSSNLGMIKPIKHLTRIFKQVWNHQPVIFLFMKASYFLGSHRCIQRPFSRTRRSRKISWSPPQMAQRLRKKGTRAAKKVALSNVERVSRQSLACWPGCFVLCCGWCCSKTTVTNTDLDFLFSAGFAAEKITLEVVAADQDPPIWLLLDSLSMAM